MTTEVESSSISTSVSAATPTGSEEQTAVWPLDYPVSVGLLERRIAETLSGISTNKIASKEYVDASVSAEAERAKTAEEANADAIAEEIKRSTDVDDAHVALIDSLTGSKLDKSSVGTANGVAGLDENGHVPSSQLPSYVDDVLEFATKGDFPGAKEGDDARGETGKIYVALDTNLTYRWSGTAYVEISPSLALGETAATAYAGDKGKANADAIREHVSSASNPHKVTAAQVGVTLSDGTLKVGDQSITPLTSEEAFTTWRNATRGFSAGVGSSAVDETDGSSAVGLGNTASGNLAAAFGNKNRATAANAAAVGHDNDASASYASALGSENTASGTWSAAVGRNNKAKGQSSAAFGVNAEATASASSAFGVSAKAYAENSAVVGYHAYAGADEKWKGSLAVSQTPDKIYLGSSTDDSGASAKTLKKYLDEASAETDPVFVKWRDEYILTAAGYEASASNRGVKNTSSVAVGAYNLADGANTSAVGCGGNTARGASSSAFGCDNDAGHAVGDGTYTGSASAFGNANEASGERASAFGHANEASGERASAFGHGNIAPGTDASAFGCDNINITGERASAFGYGNDATGESAAAFGHGNSAEAKESSAFGCGNSVNATYVDGVKTYDNAGSSAFGYGNSVEGQKATAIGCENKVVASNATAVGYKAYAQWVGALAVSQTPENIYLGATVSDKGASARTLKSYLDEKASAKDLAELSALVGEANERLEAVA